MKIETEHNVDEMVFVIHDNKIIEKKIIEIKINIYKSSSEETYTLDFSLPQQTAPEFIYFSPYKVFRTKKELLESL